MAFEQCIAEIRAASGDQIDDAEAGRILQQAFNRASRYEKDGMSRANAAVRAAQELGDEARLRAAVEKRNLLLNLKVRRELNEGVAEGKEAESVRAILSGVEGGERGWGYSVDAQAHFQSDELFGGLVGELRSAEMLKMLNGRNQPLERDIAREMWRINEPEKWPATGNKIAADAAAILAKYNEVARQRLNAVGAFIGKNENYITRQSHDQLKIRGKGQEADFVAWRDDIISKLDDRTFDDVEDRNAFLRDTWKALSSGLHDSNNGADWLAGFKGPGNLGKSLSHERVLHFKDADSWFDYNQRWGRGGVYEGVVNNLNRAGRNIALMRRLGPNPEAMFDDWIDKLATNAKDRNDFGQTDKLQVLLKHRLLDQVTGRAAIPDHLALAQVGQTLRNVEALSKLGGVVLSSAPDIGNSAATLKWSGVPLFQRWGELIATPFTGRRGGAERAIADEMGVGIDTLKGQVLSRLYAVDGVPGKLSSLVNLFHRVNFLSYWTDSFKTTVGLMASKNMARVADSEFGQLDSRLQITLRRFGIEEGEWNAIRQAEKRAEDGHDYLMPGSMLSLPDEAIAHLLPEGASPRQFNELRDDLRSKYGTYLSEQTREAMTEPSAADRLLVTWGMAPGTAGGEALRLFMQFKQFPITVIRRHLNREWNRGETVDIGGLAGMMISTTLLGYAAMTLKELARGRDPRDQKTPQDYVNTVLAAMAQGGGAGIYGDFLFGQYNRLGGGLAGTLTGPTVGTLDQLRQMIDTVEHGSTRKTRGELLAAEGVRLLANNAPFINLFYTRMAIDYLFLYGLQEAVNPGYLRRYERKIMRDNAQEFWLRPTQAPRLF